MHTFVFLCKKFQGANQTWPYSKRTYVHQISMLLLDDVYLLYFVVRLQQWANGFSFLIVPIDGLAVYSFFLCGKEVL